MPELQTTEERRADGPARARRRAALVARGLDGAAGPARSDRAARGAPPHAPGRPRADPGGSHVGLAVHVPARRGRGHGRTTWRPRRSPGCAVQACGDAHLLNFGVFATPERNLVFDVNDFDETLPGPWEWDVKRLAASIAVAGRGATFAPARRRRSGAEDGARATAGAWPSSRRWRRSTSGTSGSTSTPCSRSPASRRCRRSRTVERLMATGAPPHEPDRAPEADRAGRRRAPDHRGSAAHPARRPPVRRRPRHARGVRRLAELASGARCSSATASSTRPARSSASAASAPAATSSC